MRVSSVHKAFPLSSTDFHVNYYSNCDGSDVVTPTIVYYGLHNVSSSVSGPISLSGSDPRSSSGGADVVSSAASDAVASNARKTMKSLAGECASVMSSSGACLRQNSLLYLLLMLGTVWLGLSLYNFTKT